MSTPLSQFARRSLGLHTGLHRMAPEHGGMLLHEDDVIAHHPETRVQAKPLIFPRFQRIKERRRIQFVLIPSPVDL